jgi:hypothetical protein
MGLKRAEILRLTEPDWRNRFDEQVKNNFNFVMVGDSPLELRAAFVEQSGQSDYAPEPLQRWDLFALQEVLPEEELKSLLEEDRKGKAIALIEELRCPSKRPPVIQPFILYCELRGILSQHENRQSAQEKLIELMISNSTRKNLLFPVMYGWANNRWEIVRTAF